MTWVLLLLLDLWSRTVKASVLGLAWLHLTSIFDINLKVLKSTLKAAGLNEQLPTGSCVMRSNFTPAWCQQLFLCLLIFVLTHFLPSWSFSLHNVGVDYLFFADFLHISFLSMSGNWENQKKKHKLTERKVTQQQKTLGRFYTGRSDQ